MCKKNKEKMWFWRPFFVFLMLTDTFEFSTPKLFKNKRKKLQSNVEQSSMFHISDQANYTHFRKKLRYSRI